MITIGKILNLERRAKKMVGEIDNNFEWPFWYDDDEKKPDSIPNVTGMREAVQERLKLNPDLARKLRNCLDKNKISNPPTEEDLKKLREALID